MADLKLISGDVNWTRSSFCGSGACVEVRRDDDVIVVRDGKHGDESKESGWTPDEWRGLLDAIKQGEDHQNILLAEDGAWFGGLWFVADEWTEFVKGVKAGEFDVEKLSSRGEVGTGVGETAGSNQIAATGAGEVEASGEPVPVAAHHQTAGWGGGPGQCGVECACGTTFDNFDTIAEAAALLDDHIAAAAPVPAVPSVPVAAQPLDLNEIRPWLAACGPCDAGYPTACSHPEGDYRVPMAKLLAEVERLRGLDPRWGSGPLVDHNPETPGTADPAAKEVAEVTRHPVGCGCSTCGDFRQSVAKEIERRDRLAETWAEDD